MFLNKKCGVDASSSRKPLGNNELYYIFINSHPRAASQTADVSFTSHTAFLCYEFSKVYSLFKGYTLQMKFLRGDSPLQFWLGDSVSYSGLLQVYLQGLKQKIMLGGLQPVDSNPKIGELIICTTDTQSIFRGYVLNQDSQIITAINIDTGALHIVTLKDLWQIDCMFFSIPPQAMCCKLWQVPNCIKWCRVLETVFRKLTRCYLTVVLKDLVFEGTFPCFVVDINVKYRNRYTFNLSVWTNFILKRIEIAEMFNFTHSNYDDVDICVDLEEKKSSFNESNCFGLGKQLRKYKSEYNSIHTVLYCPIKKGAVFWIELALKVGNPWDFFINLESMESIEKLKSIISKKGNNGLLTRFLSEPKIGSIAIGKCRDTFSRIRITGFLRFSHMGNIIAIDIDDGTTKVLWAKDLWVLDEEFLSPPALSLNCALTKYIQKPSYWDNNLQKVFKELMTKNVMKVLVLDIQYLSGSFRYIVDIKIFDDCEYDVAERMLEKYEWYVKKYKKDSFTYSK